MQTWSGSSFDWDAYVRSVAFTGGSPSEAFLCAGSLGMYRSGDGGATWNLLNNRWCGFLLTHLMQPNSLYAIRTDPVSPDDQLFVSDDRGVTWRTIQPVSGQRPAFLSIAPSDPMDLLVSFLFSYYSSNRLYRSVNAGSSWTPLAGFPATWTGLQKLAIGAGNPAPLWVHAEPEPGMVSLAKSTDGGTSWQLADSGFRLERYQWLRSFLGGVQSPSDWCVWTGARLLCTNSRGQQWRDASSSLSGLGGPSWRLTSVVKHPQAGAPLFATFENSASSPPLRLYRSPDGGNNWESLPVPAGLSWLPSDRKVLPGSGLDADLLYLWEKLEWSFPPGGRVHRTRDGGQSWQVVYDPRASASAVDVAVSPTSPLRVIVLEYMPGTGRHYVRVSTDGGQSWRARPIPVGAGALGALRWLTLSPADPDTIFIAGPGGVLRSDDFGLSWRWAGPKMGGPVAVHSADAERITGVRENEYWSFPELRYLPVRSRDGGRTWQRVGPDPSWLGLVDPRVSEVRFFAWEAAGPPTMVLGLQGSDGTRAQVLWRADLCGNGQLDPNEQCDDGNADNGDACTNACTLAPVCGNGSVEPTEECDDGNLQNGDGCDQNCTRSACGNGVASEFEECDDGNGMVGDACDPHCRWPRRLVLAGKTEAELRIRRGLAGGSVPVRFRIKYIGPGSATVSVLP